MCSSEYLVAILFSLLHLKCVCNLGKKLLVSEIYILVPIFAMPNISKICEKINNHYY